MPIMPAPRTRPLRGVKPGPRRARARSMQNRPIQSISGATALSPPSESRRDNGRDAKPGVKITKPGNFQAHRMGVPGPSNPITRNAIGQPVTTTPHAIDGTKHFGPKLQPTDAVSGVSRIGVAGKSLGEPNVGSQNAGSFASVRIPSRSKIDGAGLIRPASALSAVGGPAKPMAGINGTTLRPKH